MAKQEYKCQNQDKFPGEVVAKLVDATNHALSVSKFIAWDEITMKRLWRGRPLKDLLKHPEINHLFPCLDTATIATHYLARKGEDVYLKVLTEKGATEAFKQERARIMHVDSLVELIHQGVPYCLDIGCGDITILTPTKNTSSDSLEQEYHTTRHEQGEGIWTRTPFLRVKGQDLVRHADLSPLDFLDNDKNLVKVPYGVSREDFYASRNVEGKENILRINKRDYNPEAARTFNRQWIEDNKDFLPGLKEFRYD